jgi:hypothetical protein
MTTGSCSAVRPTPWERLSSHGSHGLMGRRESTGGQSINLARTHVIPALGTRKPAQLWAEEVDDLIGHESQHAGCRPLICSEPRRATMPCMPTSVSLFTGARTEELQALTWSHINLDGEGPRWSCDIDARGRPRPPRPLRTTQST